MTDWRDVPPQEVDFSVQVWEDNNGWKTLLGHVKPKEVAYKYLDSAIEHKPNWDYRIISHSMLSWVSIGDIHKKEDNNG